jgi:hypothetical protein
VVSRIRGKRNRGKQSVYLKFIRTFSLKESLHVHGFPVGDPGGIHDHTALRAIRAISRKRGVYAHICGLAVFTIRKVFLGSNPRWFPVRMVSRSKHVASELEGLLSLSPPSLHLSELSWHVSFESFQRVRYPIICWLRHRKYKSLKMFVKWWKRMDGEAASFENTLEQTRAILCRYTGMRPKVVNETSGTRVGQTNKEQVRIS